MRDRLAALLLASAVLRAAPCPAAERLDDGLGQDPSRVTVSDFLLGARSLAAPRTPPHREPLQEPARPGPSLFDADFPFTPSPLPEVGSGGLFPPHDESGAEIALLTNGEASLAARLQSLRRATRSIRIQALVFFGDETGLYVADVLKRLKVEKPGLDIRVVVDALSNLVDDKAKADPARWAQTQLMYYDLEQNGIPVEGFAPFYGEWINEVSFSDPAQFNKRFHDKLWIVDAETPQGVAIMGGMNIANEYFRMEDAPEHRWRDQDIMVRGPVVADLAAAFDRNFKSQEAVAASRPGPLDTDLASAALQEAVSLLGAAPLRFAIEPGIGGGPATLRIRYFRDESVVARIKALEEGGSAPEFAPAKTRFIQSRPRLKETFITQAYLAMIRAARREILIANAYFVPRGDVLRALQEAARRGVDVTILTNSDATNDLPELTYVSRSLYQDLLQAGGTGHVRICEWTGQTQGAPAREGTMHAKYMIVDRKDLVIGSYNLDPRSEQLNSETVMALENEQLAQTLARQYLEKDLRKAKVITAEEAQRFHHPEDLGEKFRLAFSMSLDSWIGF